LILPLSLFLALLLQKTGKWGKGLAMALLFPMVLPASAIVIVVNLVFAENGLLSQLTGPTPWMDSPFAFVILLGLYLWKNVGIGVVILLAGLTTIPRELYESAHMDGAGRWARLTKVTLPMLRPELLVVTILSSLNAFKNFREAFVLGGDHPHESIYMLQHFMNNNFENMNFPRLSVAAVVFFALLFCLYALLLKSPLGRGEPALENGSRRDIPPKKGPILFLTLISLLFVLPVVLTVACSFLSPQEVQRVFAPLLGEGSTAAVGALPQGFSLMGYYEVFFATPDYLAKFWVSLLLSVGAILGQMVISCMGGFAFAFYDFPGKRLLYGLLCLFMLIPLQVTLLPNYLLLDQLGALNTYWALLLPLAFAPLGTFLLTQIFRSVPVDILHAARLDGAGTLQVLARVLLPCGKSGVSTLIILTLIESWNMVEQPLIYLRDVGSYPLSVFLASRYMENLPFQFVCSVLSLLPLVLCFLYFGGDVLRSAGRKGDTP
ncbi:MAG: ABC transporter permease subunit, partial [Acutalibacter sp.]